MTHEMEYDTPPDDDRIERMTSTSAAYLIKALREIKDALEIFEREYKEKCAPYAKTSKLIEAALTIKMDRDNMASVKSPYGTAYFASINSIKVVDRDKWFAWISENNAWDCLTGHIAKDTIANEYGYDKAGDYDGEGDPGIKIESIRKLHIRKPGK